VADITAQPPLMRIFGDREFFCVIYGNSHESRFSFPFIQLPSVLLFIFNNVYMLTSSNGHPLDRKTVWDCRINNFNSLSFISASCVGFVRIIVIFNVTLDVNSPRISLTDINVLSVILSSGSGFQFLIIIAPIHTLMKKKAEDFHT
jgi:hypothetical protein